MTAAEKVRLSEAEYLAKERASDHKHEYVNGEMVAMAGGSPRHNIIATNIAGALWGRLRGGPCRPLNSDQRVHVREPGSTPTPTLRCSAARPRPTPKTGTPSAIPA